MLYLNAFILSVSLFFTSVSFAELYKHVDEEGVTTYSDIEAEGAEQIHPPEGNTITLPRYTPGDKPPDEDEDAYTSLLILSPATDSTIRDNNGNFSVSLQLTPELMVDKGHSISVYVGGQAVVTNSSSLTIPVTNIDRGSHTVHAAVYDSEQKNLIQSNKVMLHLKRFSVLHNKPN